MKNISKYCSLLFCLSLLAPRCCYAAEDASAIVKAAIDYWRGETSQATAEMIVHRSDWQRTMKMQVWTKDSKRSLVRFTEPKKDAGNASLIIDNEMWSFAPKVNRIIKIPSSMRTQSWMGSDLSYNDLSKSDTIVDQYTHTLLEVREHSGQKLFFIEAIPKENAPVVWGKEILHIRGDNIIVRHEFYDQEMKLVKYLEAVEIAPLGGKIYAKIMQMNNLEEPGNWTRIIHEEAAFGIPLSESIFTQTNLRNTRVE